MAKLTISFEVPRKDGKRKVVFNLSHRGGRKRIPVSEFIRFCTQCLALPMLRAIQKMKACVGVKKNPPASYSHYELEDGFMT